MYVCISHFLTHRACQDKLTFRDVLGMSTTYNKKLLKDEFLIIFLKESKLGTDLRDSGRVPQTILAAVLNALSPCREEATWALDIRNCEADLSTLVG